MREDRGRGHEILDPFVWCGVLSVGQVDQVLRQKCLNRPVLRPSRIETTWRAQPIVADGSQLKRKPCHGHCPHTSNTIPHYHRVHAQPVDK